MEDIDFRHGLNPVDALRLGWSIIPVGSDGNPLALGGEFQDSKLTSSQATRLHMVTKPAAWAVVSGIKSGMIVLSFSKRTGYQTLRLLGLFPHFLDGSGYVHVFFKHPGWPAETVALNADRYPGLNSRAEGDHLIYWHRDPPDNFIWLTKLIPFLPGCLPRDLREDLGLAYPPGEPSQAPEWLLVKQALEMTETSTYQRAGLWLAQELENRWYCRDEAREIMFAYADKVGQQRKKRKRPYSREDALDTLEKVNYPTRLPVIQIDSPPQT